MLTFTIKAKKNYDLYKHTIYIAIQMAFNMQI